jgi:hypothetical protein
MRTVAGSEDILQWGLVKLQVVGNPGAGRAKLRLSLGFPCRTRLRRHAPPFSQSFQLLSDFLGHCMERPKTENARRENAMLWSGGVK